MNWPRAGPWRRSCAPRTPALPPHRWLIDRPAKVRKSLAMAPSAAVRDPDSRSRFRRHDILVLPGCPSDDCVQLNPVFLEDGLLPLMLKYTTLQESVRPEPLSRLATLVENRWFDRDRHHPTDCAPGGNRSFQSRDVSAIRLRRGVIEQVDVNIEQARWMRYVQDRRFRGQAWPTLIERHDKELTTIRSRSKEEDVPAAR